MSEPKQTIVSSFEPPHVSLRSYVVGFVSCVVLTLLAYLTATTNHFSKDWAVGIIAALAVVQCIVQLIKFLHLGTEFKPRWKLAVFCLMIVIVLIVVIGSIWIMSNLNYRMMQSPKQMNEYIQGQDGL